MSNREYKIAEVISNYDREMMIDKILEEKVDSLSHTYSGDDLINEIVELNLNGVHGLNDMEDKELAEMCVDVLDRNDEWGEIE